MSVRDPVGVVASIMNWYPPFDNSLSLYLMPIYIDQVGETVDVPAIPFEVVPEFQYLHTW
jgi:hypothetical protein